MALTRAQLETILIARRGKQLAMVELDGETADGTNAALAEPIRAGLAFAGIHPADPSDPTDDDLAKLSPDQVAMVADVAELQTLEMILGNWHAPDESAGSDSQGWGRFFFFLNRQAEALRQKVRDLYGYGDTPLEVGLVDLNFAESGDIRDEWNWPEVW